MIELDIWDSHLGLHGCPNYQVNYLREKQQFLGLNPAYHWPKEDKLKPVWARIVGPRPIYALVRLPTERMICPSYERKLETGLVWSA